MNASLIPFVIVPVIALGVGITLILMALTGDGPHNTFLILGAILTGIGILLPMLFWFVTKPTKKR
jgi:hypothetical protein